MVDIMYELKDYLNAINFEKKPLLDSEDLTWERNILPILSISVCLCTMIVLPSK